MFVPTDNSGIKSVNGDPIDEVSLLSLIAGQFFQSIPVYEDEVHEHSENPNMRFLVKISINNTEASKGYGRNKKSAKYAAAQILLQLICPRIYREWAKDKQKVIPEFNQDDPAAQQITQGLKGADLEMRDDFPTDSQTGARNHTNSNKENHLPGRDLGSTGMEIDQIKEKPFDNDKSSPEKHLTPEKSASGQVLSKREESLDEGAEPDDSNTQRPQLNFELDQSQAAYFKAEKLQEIEQNLDAFMDDPELLKSKKSLVDKFTPCSVVNSLKGKFKDHGITAHDSRRRNPSTLSSDLFMHTVRLEKLGVQGQAEELSKKSAQQRASQLFLKNLFPKGTSWL